jgi:heat shock protein HtpX
MISALRKIEGRGELPGATSSIMEMCIDNPREGFGELFDTHPSVESRITAIVKFAGGHDPGPLALPPADDTADDESTAESPWKSAEQQTNSQTAAENDTNEDHGPWSQPESEPAPAPGPWGPHRS